MLSIKPVPSKYRFRLDSSYITLHMKPEPNTTYTVSIDGNLADIWGQKLGNQSADFKG